MVAAVSASEKAIAAAEGLRQKLAEEGLADIEVTIGKGSTNTPMLGAVHDGMRDEITIVMKGQAIEDQPVDTTKRHAYAVLGTIDAAKRHVEFDEPGEHLDKQKNRLRSFIAKGAKIPEGYLKWGGLDKELNKDNDWYSRTEDQAIRGLRGSTTEIGFSTHAPETQEAQDKKPVVETSENKVDTYVNGNTAEIKEMMIKRLSMDKYLGPRDEADIRKKVGDLTIESKNGYVTIMSPEQKAETDRLKDPKAEPLSEEKQKQLAATNILSGLSVEKLGKIIGRSFLHAGEKADEIFPLIAGREDMKRAIERQLKVLKYSEAGQKDPELAKSIDEFLADDIFKKHDYNERNKLKKPPLFDKSSDPEKKGIATITLSLPKGEGDNVLAALSALAGQQQCDTPQDIANDILMRGPKNPGEGIIPASKDGWANGPAVQKSEQGWTKSPAA